MRAGPNAAISIALLLLAACSPRSSSSEEPRPSPSPVPESVRARLLEIGRAYPSFGRVREDLIWAPTDCIDPRSVPPLSGGGELHWSEPRDAGAHRDKVYYLYASNRATYRERLDKARPHEVGTVVVKESWLPEEVPFIDAGSPGVDRVRHGGKTYRAGRKASLFVMYKLDPATPGTDRGWVYGTLDAAGTTVTSGGDLEACAGCHRSAVGDRVFGVQGI
jgi:hypothetical protein